jgi:hypothetical protein
LRQIDVNLATHEYFDKRLAMLLMIAAAILMVIISGITIYRHAENENQLKDYDQKITRTQKLISQKTQLQLKTQKKPNRKNIRGLAKKIEAINELIARDAFPWNRFIDQLERKIPEGLFIKSFSPSDNYNKLIITGRADSAHKITFFLRRLEEWDLIRSTIIRNLDMKSMESGAYDQAQNRSIGFTLESKIAIERLFTNRESTQLGKIFMKISRH